MSRVIETFLMPVDFSPHATEALHYAALLAECFPASLIALHVIAKERERVSTSQPSQAALARPYAQSGMRVMPYAMESSSGASIDMRQRAQSEPVSEPSLAPSPQHS